MEEEKKKEKKEETVSKKEYLKLKRESAKKSAIIVVLVFAMALMILLITLYYINGNIKRDSNSNNDNSGKDNNIVEEKDDVEYKTSSGKYTLKISDDKILINDKEINKDIKKESQNYLQVIGSFTDGTGANYIDPYISIIVDKKTGLIVEQNIYPVGSEDKNAFGEYAIFAHRIGLGFVNVNGWDFFTFESEGPTEVYTTDWKKIGYQLEDTIKSDSEGIYVCEVLDEILQCSSEGKYDSKGNKLD